MTPGGPLDPRVVWFLAALHQLYQELEPGDQPIGLSIQALSAGQVVTYGLSRAGDGEIIRYVTDPDDLADVAEALGGVLDTVTTDATVPDGPP